MFIKNIKIETISILTTVEDFIIQDKSYTKLIVARSQTSSNFYILMLFIIYENFL